MCSYWDVILHPPVNFVAIQRFAAELSRHIDFFQDGGHKIGNLHVGSGFVMALV